MSALSLVAAQQEFTRTISAVEDAVKFAFRRRLRPQEYEEALADAKAAAWSAWAGLIKRGKDPLAVGVHGIASNAIRYVRNGRKLGCGTPGRGAMDVYHRKAQARCGFMLVSLDSFEEMPTEPFGKGGWRDWLAEAKTCTPADLAASRIDLAGWLSRLPERKRRFFEMLAQGHDGIVVARRLGLSPGRVSQVRAELKASWREFQGQTSVESKPTTVAREGATRRLGRPRLDDRDFVKVATGPIP